MAEKITMAQKKAMAKANVLKGLTDALATFEPEYVGSTPYVRQEIDGTEIWIEVKLTAKNNTDVHKKDGTVVLAFDPFVAREDYEAEQAIKAEKTAEKEKAKAAKIARDEALRAKKKAAKTAE